MGDERETHDTQRDDLDGLYPCGIWFTYKEDTTYVKKKKKMEIFDD
jgi:hypothetical protein